MRAIRKGSFQCSLITVPLEIFSPVAKLLRQFRLDHESCGSHIQQENICPVYGMTLGIEEIDKGFRYGRDVVLTNHNFTRARKGSTKTIKIFKFGSFSEEAL